jgi:ssRNA-specific RNase YbeY (16S rRNA maturation enzyme)
MVVPKKFKIFGETIKVKRILKIDSKHSWGEYDESKNTIKIKKTLNKEQQEQTYCHEVVHCMLHNLGYEKLNNDEVFIDRMAKALHQILTTSEE